MAETDFLSFLVDETLKLQKKGEARLSSLEQKLNDYNLSYIKGEFLPQTQMLRFNAAFGVIDIPVNWSVFSMTNPEASNQILTVENDRDHLFEVLKTAWKQDFGKILVTHADGFCYIVGLIPGEDNYLHDLLNPQEMLRGA